VTEWAGHGTLDEVLHDLTRMASAPKLAVR
jgi:hypothetical protein